MTKRKEAAPAVKPGQRTATAKQYDAIKEQYPDVILMFRIGDYYEMFREDAITTAKVLNLTLTNWHNGETSVPMTGVPHHSHEKYVSQLVAAGYRVAICDQTEDPKTAKGATVKRAIRMDTGTETTGGSDEK